MHVVLCSTELLLDVRCLIAEHVYPDNRSLGLPFMEQVAAREVGESDKLYLVASWCCIDLLCP